MQKRIFLNFVGLILICAVFMAMSFGLLFYRVAKNHEKAAIRDKAHLVAVLLDLNIYEHPEIVGGGTRITIISLDGWVLSDSHPGVDLEINRGDREEFIQALAYGSGEAIRSSDTFGTETFYYAIGLESGDILRLSRTLYGLNQVFRSTLPALFLVTAIILIMAYFIARRLTKKIIQPLGNVDFDSSVSDSLYEELWPYIRKINNQKREIADQMTTLQNRTETIEAIIANMREGIVMLDEKGTVLAANKSVRDIFNLKKRHILQNNFGHIYREPEFMQAVKQCLEGTHLKFNFSQNNKFYNAFLSPSASGGAIIFFVDVTAQHKAEKQRRKFTANVSHELKTPLTTISALSEMMASGMAKPEDMPGFSEKISAQTHRLINIIDEIIRLSEFDESKVEKEFVVFDVFDVATSVASALADKAAEKSISLELTGHPLKIKANSRLIDELMYNLVDNGIKYNKVGGSVILNICEEDGFCKISVSDTGIGITKKHQGRVFERFYRVDSSRCKKTGDTGLGLSIVKHIAEHHNGKISLTSTKGVGTTVTCLLSV